MDVKVSLENLLSQETLQLVETLCTQEQPAACVATCPLHVDARAMAKHIEQGNFSDAFKLLQKKVPFPGLIAHICDAPCEKACKRNMLGGSIQINHLELAAFTFGYQPVKPPLFLPKANKKVIILGGGLRGMTAAVDLARKGFQVELYEKNERLGGSLWGLCPAPLPEDILTREIQTVLDLPVHVHYNQDLQIETLQDAVAFLKGKEGDALYIAYNCQLFSAGSGTTTQTGEPAIFTGSRLPEQAGSPIVRIYDGRSTATAIERWLKNVSLMSGREQEGPFETKLFTDLSQIENQPTVTPAQPGRYTEEEARKEGGRCIQCECLQCVKGCAYMQHYKAYPKRYVREVYNNLSIAMGRRHANKFINTCNACGQCGQICPNGLNMKDVILAARNIMVNTGKMPVSAHEFALLDMDYSNSGNHFLAKHQPGHNTSTYLYFPSCQLSALEPDLVKTSYQDLCTTLDGGVGLMLGCCGVMAYWAGKEEIFQETIAFLTDHWKNLGEPTIITACPTCKQTLSEATNIPTMGLWEVYGNYLPPSGKNKGTIAIHDPCGARYDENTQNMMRSLVAHMGYEIEEPVYNHALSPCCGYGGLTPFVDKPLAKKIAGFRCEQTPYPYLTYCINCRDRFIREGKDSFHYLELIYGPENTKHKAVTWSERQDNRKRLKKDLLSTLWEEQIMADERELPLILDAQMETLLDDRMILHSDIQKTLQYAEDTKSYFINPENGQRTASYRDKNVTFWIQYSVIDENYHLHNAYSHRMTIES